MKHIENLQKSIAKNDEKRSDNKSFNNEYNIWYKWTPEQVVRFVGDFIQQRSHWIGPSEFNNTKILTSDAFSGEDKVPFNVNCANWDLETEEYDPNGPCVICKLRKVVYEILKSEKDALDESQQKRLDQLHKKCGYRQSYSWNLIDREEAIGFKIANLGKGLLESLLNLHSSYQPSEFWGEEDGVDLVVKKTKKDGGSGSGKGKTDYSASFVMEGPQAKVTPLTDVEKGWDMFDLKVLCGKQQDQDKLRSMFDPEWQQLLEAYETDDDEDENENKGKAKKDGGDPF